jgi:protein ImuB
MLYLCLHVGDFAAQALPAARAQPGGRAVAVMSGAAPLERVFAANAGARALGVQTGMSRLQAASFGVLLLPREQEHEEQAFAALMECAGRFSPRVEAIASPGEQSAAATLLLDIAGTERLLGPAAEAARRLQQQLAGTGYEAAVACAQTACAALLMARALAAGGVAGLRAGYAPARGAQEPVVISAGCEAAALAPLPLAVLEPDAELAASLESWGIRTLGELAALPARALAARLGERGVQLRALARGEQPHLLSPAEEPADAPITESLALEHPVENLEPLLFLLSQLLERVLQRAAQRALAIASVETTLKLEGSALPRLPKDGRYEAPVANCPTQAQRRGLNGPPQGAEHRRLVRPALPERERMTLFKLVQLDLEMHPPAAAVVGMCVVATPAPPQQAQQGLFAAQAPEAGQMEILLARLRKLVGAGRVGAAELLDTHAPESFQMSGFVPPVDYPTQAQRTGVNGAPAAPAAGARLAMRMVRPPRVVHVELRGCSPAVLHHEGQRLSLHAASGPWRTDGAWWTHPAWCREEWEVTVQGACCLRLAHDPAAQCWYLIGSYD